MQELIDRQAALRLCKDADWEDDRIFIAGYDHAIRTMAQAITELPTIEPEVRHGRWIPYTKNRDENVTNVFQCSECEKTVRFIMAHKMCEYTFCPFCNAKMGGADNG